MEKEFIPYAEALALKELGFDEPCITYYGNISECLFGLKGDIKFHTNTLLDIGHGKNVVSSAPLYQQVFRWFREKYNLLGNVYSNASGWLWEIHDNIGGTHRFVSEWSGDCKESGMFTSFEKAELECLKKLIEIAKEHK